MFLRLKTGLRVENPEQVMNFSISFNQFRIMKRLKKKCFFYFVALWFVSGCTKVNEVELGNSLISVSAEIASFNDNNLNKKQGALPVKSHKDEGGARIASTPDFDVLIHYDQESSTSFSARGGAEASTKMEPGKKFLLRIFEDEDNHRGDQIGPDYIFTIGGNDNPEIYLDGGKTYHWIAFSINESFLPPLDNNDTFSATDIANKDVLYDSGSIETVAGTNLLKINFAHMTSRIVVKFNSQGMFMPFNGNSNMSAGVGRFLSSNFVSVITSKNFDFLTGQFVGSAQPVEAIKFTENDPQRHAIKYAYFHSAEPISLSSEALKIEFSNPDFYPWYSNGSMKFLRTTILDGNNQEAINLSQGESFQVTVDLIQSAININGVLWARDILAYSSEQFGMPRLRLMAPFGNHSARFFYLEQHYFRWNALTPTSPSNTGTSYDPALDPCRTLHPAGTWRMPTDQEANSLVDQPYNGPFTRYMEDRSNTTLRNDCYIFISHTRTSGAPTPEFTSPQKNEISLFFSGYRFPEYIPNEDRPWVNSVAEFIQEMYKIGTATSPKVASSMFWTSQPGYTSSLTARAYVRKANLIESGSTDNHVTLSPAYILDVERNVGISVRCVRTNSSLIP